jgi:hypothetical protein
MLYFLPNKPNVVYISVCDWGEIKRLQKVTPSLYGFAKEQDVTNTKYAPKLFFVYSELGITNSLQQMPKQHV